MDPESMLQKSIPKHRELESFIMDSKHAFLSSRGRYYLYLFKTISKSAFCSVGRYRLYLPRLFALQTPWKIVSEEEFSALPTRGAEILEIYGEFSLTISIPHFYTILASGELSMSMSTLGLF